MCRKFTSRPRRYLFWTRPRERRARSRSGLSAWSIRSRTVASPRFERTTCSRTHSHWILSHFQYHDAGTSVWESLRQLNPCTWWVPPYPLQMDGCRPLSLGNLYRRPRCVLYDCDSRTTLGTAWTASRPGRSTDQSLWIAGFGFLWRHYQAANSIEVERLAQ